jgi:hypothetical protein
MDFCTAVEIDKLSASEFLTDDEGETENQTDYEVAVNLDILGTVKLVSSEKSHSDIDKVKLALKLMGKARTLQLKANSLLSSMVLKNPSASHFVELITSIDSPAAAHECKQQAVFAPQSQSKSKFVQHVDRSQPTIVPHKKVLNGTTRFVCAVCNTNTGSWSGCDAHIRKTHSFMKYGPCSKCDFTSFNIDSFRHHLNICK